MMGYGMCYLRKTTRNHNQWPLARRNSLAWPCDKRVLNGDRAYGHMFLIKMKRYRQIRIIFFESPLCLTFGSNRQHPTVSNWDRQGDIAQCICSSPDVPYFVTAPWLWTLLPLLGMSSLHSRLLGLGRSYWLCAAALSVTPSPLPSLELPPWGVRVCVHVYLTQRQTLLRLFGEHPTLWGSPLQKRLPIAAESLL